MFRPGIMIKPGDKVLVECVPQIGAFDGEITGFYENGVILERKKGTKWNEIIDGIKPVEIEQVGYLDYIKIPWWVITGFRYRI